MGDQFGFVPDSILPGLAGARALGERGSEASFTVPLLRPPDRIGGDPQKINDCGGRLLAMRKQEDLNPVPDTPAELFCLFLSFQESFVLGGEANDERLHGAKIIFNPIIIYLKIKLSMYYDCSTQHEDLEFTPILASLTLLCHTPL